MFTKEKSAIVKGCAVWMMLLHHCFLAGRFEKFNIIFWPLADYQVSNIANFCKICVSLFAFISGFGLLVSYEKEESNPTLKNSNNRWIVMRLVKTLTGYWFVVFLSWIVCMAIDYRPVYAYGFSSSIFNGLWNMAMDFLGIGYFFGVAPLNGTWWYMSAAIVYIVLTPLLYISLSKIGWLSTLGILMVLPRINGVDVREEHIL